MAALRSDWPGRVALAAGLAVSALGVAVLFAWSLHFVPLIQVFPALAPMHRMTALGFLLAGSALVFASVGQKRVAGVLSLVLLALAVLVFLEYALDADFGIDQLLGRDYIKVRTSSPGRMSPVSTFCFLSTSLALLTLTTRTLARYASSVIGIVASVLTAVGTVTVLAYLLGNTDAYGWGHFTRVSLHSGSSLVLLGAGLLALAWKERPVKPGLPGWAPLSVALGLSAGVLGVWQALMAHEESDIPMLSSIVLGGGLLLALLLALAVYQAQRARSGSQALRQSEERFRGVFEKSPLGLALIQQDYRLAAVNPALCRMSGYSEAELVGINPLDVTHPDDRQASMGLAERLFKGEIPFYQVEKRYVKKSGEIIWVNMTATVVRDREGRPLFGLGMVHDITERRRVETELRLGSEIFANMEEGVCLVRIADGIIVHANHKFERMFGYQPDEIVGQPVAVINSPSGRPSREIEEEIRAAVLRSGTWSGEILHRRKDGTPLWCAVTGSVFHHPEFGEVGISIHQDITERKKAEEALRQSEERFRSLFEQGPLGVTLMAPDYRLVRVNAAFCRMMGYSEAELTTMTPLDITYPDDRDPTVNVVERLFKTEIPIHKIEKRYVKKNGEVIWGSLTACVIHDREGKPLYAMGMIEDITERKRTEDELRILTQRLSLATRSAAMGVWEWNLGTERAIWDDTMFQILGIPKKASVGREDWARPMHPDDLAKADAFLETIIRGKAQDRLEFRVVRPNGSLRYVSAAGGAVLDARGNVIAVAGIAFDISERKRAEEELHALSTRLRQAARFSSMGVWEWDPATRRPVLDDTAFAMMGIAKVPRLDFEEFARWVHPNDLPKVEAALETIVRQKTQESVEFRVVRPDGAVRHAYAAGGAVLDQQGNVVRVVGTAFDITKRKRAEEELRALSERLALATRTASIGIWEWDLRTDLVTWDPTTYEMFGIPKSVRMSYKKWARMVHPEDLPKTEALLQQTVSEKTQGRLEFRIIRPDGSLRHISAAEGVVLDEQGKVVRVVGTSVDVTERKQMEAKLEASREQMVASARLSALGMMAGGIAHEINNPLGIIHAMASDLGEMVEEKGSAPPQVVARKSAIIRETAERIARIVKSLRQISREGASDTLHPTRLAKILEETLELCRARFKAHGVKLLLPHTIPELSIFCREVQIEQALLNLLQNAFDAVVEQEGERWVKVEVGTGDDAATISVIDNGAGIPPEHRSRIGEPFFTTKEVGKGTGLGLSLTKTIAEEHGGKLKYSEDRGHTRFALVLPLARVAEAA